MAIYLRQAAITAVLAWFILLLPLPVRAQTQPQQPQQPQQPTQQSPSEVSVPRGAGGVIITPPQQATATGKATPPRVLNYVPPEYPPEAEKAGLEGAVTLQLDVDYKGRVTQAVVVESAGHGFDESAVQAAKKLEFEPAHRADGSPVGARILYRYTFDLKSKTQEPTARAIEKAIDNFRGKVLASGGDIPLAGATVSIVSLRQPPMSKSITTDETGTFVFVDLAPGKYKVKVSSPGFESLEVEEEIGSGEQVAVKYRIVPEATGLEVVVRGERPAREVTRRTLERREISRIPGTNGDALRSIQNLPGVARPPAIAGVLIVRGSAPFDTQTFIDGTPVPLIYHFGGLSSVVPTEMLEKIDFYPGNFSTQYGRVMGGIVDVGIRSPKDDGLHGLAQVDFIDARAMLEGPIPFFKNLRFAAAGRRSYIDAWLGPALEAAGAGVTQAPVYYDYQFLVEGDPTPDARLRLSFFGSDDALKLLLNDPQPQEPALSGNVGLHTAFKRLQLLYTHDLTDQDTITSVVALGDEDLDFGLGPFYFLLDLYTLTGRFEYSRRLFKGITFNTGLDIFSGTYTVNLRAPGPPRPGEPPNQPFSTRAIQELSVDGDIFFPAGYVEFEVAPDARAKIVPGLRLDYQNVNERVDVSPRINGRYDIIQGFPRTTAKAGIGVFHQPPQFQQVVPPLGNPGILANRALHYGLGVEQDLTRHIEVSVEGFYKQLDSLVIASAGESSLQANYKNQGTGTIFGAEVLLRYKPDERFFGWLAYTLSRSSRKDGPGEEERLVPWDQTHILTILGSYQLGHGWEFGARFRLVTGNLITPNVCNVELQTCDPGRINGLFHAPSGAYTPIPFSGPASERLPPFHQLDLRVDKRWKFKSWQLSAYLDVQNVYNSPNAEAIQYNFNYTSRQYITGIPILPSLGLRGEF